MQKLFISLKICKVCARIILLIDGKRIVRLYISKQVGRYVTWVGIYTCCPQGQNTAGSIQKDKVFIGPDFWAGKENPLFSENENLCAGIVNMQWKKMDLKVRV